MPEAAPTDAPGQRPALSLVIPAYNESARLGDSLAELRDWVAGSGQTCQLIVVDDGSSDETARIARDFDPTPASLEVLVNEQNEGKGLSVRRGALAASGEVILVLDADMNVPAQDIPRVLEPLKAGYDIAIGSRNLPVNADRAHRPWLRRVAGWLFHTIRRGLVLRDIFDTQCGFKAFTRSAAEAAFREQTLTGYGFDFEVLVLARRAGFTIKEVGVHWETKAGSKVHPFRDGLAMLREVLLVRRKWGPGRPKKPGAGAEKVSGE
jgi:dolichyl-phosphate beta-glucosyltransferase